MSPASFLDQSCADCGGNKFRNVPPFVVGPSVDWAMSPFWEPRIFMCFWIFAKKIPGGVYCYVLSVPVAQIAQDDCCAMNGNRSGRKQSCPNWRCGPIPTCVRALAALTGGGVSAVLLFRFWENSSWGGGDERRVVLHWGGGEGHQFLSLHYAQSKRHWTLHSITDNVIKLLKLCGNYMHHLPQQYISVPRDSYNP